MNNNIKQRIESFAKGMRRDALDMALVAGKKASHFGAGMSIIDVVATLYSEIMTIDKNNPQNPTRDRFILSKGHGVLGYYTALKQIGYITQEDLLTFEKNNTQLAGHPVICREKGIEFSNGSLGMGLSIGVGLALSFKRRDMDNKVYVIVGDGECNEGSNWEALMSGNQFNLDNLTCIIDYNQFQLGGTNDEIMSIYNIKEKGLSFGWNVIEINGHDIKEIYNAFTTNFENKKPKLIISNTLKGYGFSFSQNNNNWHHAILTKKQYEEAILELEGC